MTSTLLSFLSFTFAFLELNIHALLGFDFHPVNKALSGFFWGGAKTGGATLHCHSQQSD